jgi:hypothetical protein
MSHTLYLFQGEKQLSEVCAVLVLPFPLLFNHILVEIYFQNCAWKWQFQIPTGTRKVEHEGIDFSSPNYFLLGYMVGGCILCLSRYWDHDLFLAGMRQVYYGVGVYRCRSLYKVQDGLSPEIGQVYTWYRDWY